MAVSLASINVNGVAERHKRLKVFECLRAMPVDLFFLQETHLADHSQGKTWEKEWGGHCAWSPGSNRSAGVAVLVHPNSAAKLVDHKSDLAGRVVTVSIDFQGHRFQIINVYGPNNHSERESFFDNLWRFKFPNFEPIVVGDFNCVPDIALDKWGGDDSFGNRAVSQLHAFTESLALEDFYRVSNPQGKQFTWFNGPHSVGCRLDRFYTPRAWRSRISRHVCSPFAYSDHHLIKLQTTFGPANPRGRGVWKFNTQLLKNESFCAAVNSFWPTWQQNKPAFTDPRVWWDAGKLQLKEIAIAHSVAEARERKQEKLNLEREFHNILSRGNSNTADDHVRLAEIKDLLKAIEDRTVEGAIIRSREQWIEFGEKPTKYFYQLEQKRQTRNAIHELRVGDQTVTSHKNILTACRDFYANLYTAEPVDLKCHDWLLDQLDTALTSEDQEKCEGSLTLAECYEALSQMQTNKSPGADGLPVEFYRRFWSALSQDLVDVLNYSFDRGQLSDSQRLGIIRLLYKKDDPLLLKNWRPISLLNTDYKICTKVLANRLKTVLSVILSEDQTCGIPGRSIYENLFLLRDTLDYVHHKQLSAALISLDQEKAFDRVNHGFLQRVLQRFNFGPHFRQWVNTVYTDIHSSVLNNGWLSATIKLERGVRQGCPLSPLLYCLVAETLGQAIRRDDSIQGITIPGAHNKQSKVSQYADDTTLILADDYSITRSFDIINTFERGSGSRLNTQKTEGLWIGSAAGKLTGPINITWTTGKLKILGVYFGTSNVEHANWGDRITKLEKRLNLWKSRTLSLKGKSLIINSIGASGLWYTATVLPMPDWAVTRINTAIYDFLWNGKTELVKRTTCQLPLQHGGLAVINPGDKARALKLRWVPLIGDPLCSSKWVFFARYWIGLALSRKIRSWAFLRSNMCPKYSGDSPPQYFTHILKAIDRLHIDLTLLPNYRVKTFYEKLTHPSPGRLPTAGAWERRLNTPLPWPHIWSNIYGGLSTNWEADIAWRVAHGILKTRAYLKTWCRLNVSERCARCGITESFSHALCECTNVPQVWLWAFTLINNLFTTPLAPSPTMILFKHGFPSSDKRSIALAHVIINITLNEIWSARNLATFDKKQQPVAATVRKIKHRLRQRIRAAYNYNDLPVFNNTWGHKQVLCKVENKTLQVLI